MIEYDDPYMNEIRRFVRFKGIVSEMLHSVRCHKWCAKHGIEIVPEIPEIEPMELFFLQARANGQTPESHSTSDKVYFAQVIGDKIPVSEGDGFAYLFPSDLYQKILVFGAIPD